MRQPSDRLYYYELVATLILFALLSLVSLFDYFAGSLFVIYRLETLLFVAFFTLFIMGISEVGKRKEYGIALHAMFAVFLLLFIAYFAAVPALFADLFASTLPFIESLAFYFVLFIPIYFMAMLGAFLYYRKGTRNWGLLVFAVLLAVMVVYFLSNHVFTYYNVDDETLISFVAVKALLHGMNPYAVSAYNLLFTNASTIGVTLTTGNNIIGVLDYPALYVFASLPFYIATPLTFFNLTHFDLGLEAMVYIILMFLAIAYLTDRKNVLSPNFALLLVLALLIRAIPSILVYLMIILVLLAYFKIDKKYSWLLLGLCVSLQEQLWLPVLFLIAYSFNSYGFRKGATDAIGALAVFLAVNGYFILQNPAAFFRNVIAPLNQYIIPNPGSPAGYFLVEIVHTSLTIFSALFALSALFLLLLLLRTNRKELIPFFSMLPFLFLQRGLFSYYIFFGFFALYVLYRKEKFNGIGAIGKEMKKHSYLLYVPLALIAIAALYLVYASHASYVQNFGASAYETNLQLNPATNTTSYTLHILHGRMSNYTVYLAVVAYNNRSMSYYGLMNQSIINGTHPCGELSCEVNVNRIVLNSSTAEQNVTVTVPWVNSTLPLTYVSSLIYQDKYFYATNGIG